MELQKTEAPNQIDEMDRMRLNLLAERTARLQTEEVNLKMISDRLQSEKALNLMEQQTFTVSVNEKYSLKPGDTIDTKTGAIRRAPVRAISEKAAS